MGACTASMGSEATHASVSVSPRKHSPTSRRESPQPRVEQTSRAPSGGLDVMAGKINADVLTSRQEALRRALTAELRKAGLKLDELDPEQIQKLSRRRLT